MQEPHASCTSDPNVLFLLLESEIMKADKQHNALAVIKKDQL